jgi:DNA-directed RNA polymerase specialized sigma24 family protein
MTQDALEYDLESAAQIIDEDQALVAATGRDAEAAGRLYDKYYGAVLGYIYHCTFDKNVAEDLTANVFLATFRHLGRYRWRQIPFRAWLYRIATNEVRMHWRRQRRVFVFKRWRLVLSDGTEVVYSIGRPKENE